MRNVWASAGVMLPPVDEPEGRDVRGVGEWRDEDEVPISSEGRWSGWEGVSTTTAAAAKFRRSRNVS